MTNQEQAYYNFLKKETAEIEHHGRKQWPTHYKREHNKTLNVPLRETSKKCSNLFWKRNLSFKKLLYIADELKMAKRKNNIGSKEYNHFKYFCKYVNDKYEDYPDRTKDPVANLLECPVCDGFGLLEEGTSILISRYDCECCNGIGQTTPQNYQGGRA